MNARERFVRTLTHQSVDRPSYGDYLVYPSTRARWESEGLPPDADLYEYFGFDPINLWEGKREVVPTCWSFGALFEREKLSEDDVCEIYQESNGVICRYLKNTPPPAMPEHLRYPISGRDDWKKFLPLFAANARRNLLDRERAAARLPAWRERDYPLGMWVGSGCGMVRDFVGVEGLSFLLYDDPALVEEIVETFTAEYVEAFQWVSERIDLDYVVFWEDIAYNHGPLFAPETYRNLFGHFYRTMMPLVEKANIPVRIVDCDGRIDELIPIWLDWGITTMHPLEAAAGMDPVRLRREYGRALSYFGGIDKRVLATTPEAIRREVLTKLEAVDSGFVVECDHAVPPDVSLDNYRYFRHLVREFYEA